MFRGRPWKRSVKVAKCWRASSVVGTTTATCLPFMAVTKAGAQRHLGLAEADIAADQPVHRPALLQIVEHRFDGGKLVLGLLIGKARAEFVIRRLRAAAGHRRACSSRAAAVLIRLLGDLADALLELRLARLPGAAAELVELRSLLHPSRSGYRSSIFSTGRNSRSLPAYMMNRQSCGAPCTSMVFRPSKRPMP